MTDENSTNTAITIRRTFDAPIDALWKAWSVPEKLADWSAPAEWTYEIFEFDFREGGVHTYCMYGPDGEESRGRTVYDEIIEHERIVHLDSFTDEDGTPVGDENVIIVEFDDQGEQTELTLTHAGLPQGIHEEATAGWESGLDKLKGYLEATA